METQDYKLIAAFGVVAFIAGAALHYMAGSHVAAVMAWGGALAAVAGMVGAIWNS